jgi:SH3-like domain-containing protein
MRTKDQHVALICTKTRPNTTRTAEAMKKNYLPIALVFAKIALSITLFSGVLASTVAPTSAQEAKLSVRGSGLPVPRFVSIKFNEANLRAGPGAEYPVLWQYRQAGLPLLVDAEFGVWRKVIDPDGVTGWMHGAGLSLRRMAFINTGMVKLYHRDNAESGVVAVAEKNALLELETCPKDWCRVANDSVKGWVERRAIWGILQDESLK